MFRVAKALGLASLRRKVRFQQKSGLLNRVFLSFDDVDWARTRAFSIGSFGQVYVNLAGTRPQGIVQPGHEYEELKEKLAQEAHKLRDPRTGELLVERVYRREEVYSGPFIDRAPDLIVQPRGWEYMAFGHADFGSNQLVEPITGLSGHHRPDGMLILSGAGVKPGTHLRGASILDLSPTILHAFGVPIPEDLDGRVLAEAFEPTSSLSRPVEYHDVSVYKDGVSQQEPSDEEMSEVQEKLRGWGYAG
jgi:predicted AlkP superfamily phosphohydrolase/phosphomutase